MILTTLIYYSKGRNQLFCQSIQIWCISGDLHLYILNNWNTNVMFYGDIIEKQII